MDEQTDIQKIASSAVEVMKNAGNPHLVNLDVRRKACQLCDAGKIKQEAYVQLCAWLDATEAAICQNRLKDIKPLKA
jgi:hypothetical protein